MQIYLKKFGIQIFFIENICILKFSALSYLYVTFLEIG